MDGLKTMTGDVSKSQTAQLLPAEGTESHRAERIRRLKRTFVSSLLMRPLAVITPFIIAPLFLRYLGEERYGLYATVISLAGFIGMSNAGITLGLVNKLTDCHVTGDRLLARRYVSSLTFAMLFIVVVGMVIASVLVPILDWKTLLKIKGSLAAIETPWAVWITAIFTLLGIVSGVPRAVYFAYQDLEINNYWDGASKLAVLLGCVAVIYTPWGLIGIALAVIGIPAVVRGFNTLSLFFLEKRWLRPSLALFDRSLLRDAMVQGICLFILELAVYALFQSDNLLISLLLGPSAVTSYDLVGRLFGLAYGVFLMVLLPLWPAYGEAIRRGDLPWVRRGVRLSLIVICGGMLCFGLILYLFEAPIFRFWMHGGATVVVSKSLILAMTATFVLRAWVDCRSVVLNPANILWPQIWFFVTHAVLNVIAAVLLTPKMGAAGVAWATPLTALLTSAWGYPLLMRKFFREAGKQSGAIDPPGFPVVLSEVDPAI